MRRHFLFVLLGITLYPTVVFAQADAPVERVKAILQTHCYRCHGQEGAVEGGMNYITDLNRLVQRKKIVPGNSAGSPLFKRLADDSMPPPDVSVRLSADEKRTIQQWIDDGAKGIVAPVRPLISDAQVREWVLNDLETIDRRSRRFTRYFTFHHLYNAGLGDDELATYRNGLSKTVNSLSWHPNIRNPEPIDTNKTILRIDLRWYMWDAVLWNRILVDYPYGLLDDHASSRAIAVATSNRLPMIRGDWFIATAMRPPLYFDMLQLPANATELERQLRIDSSVNILQERIMRAGFTGSGVSRNNRILERHDSIHGYYWRTYDFEEVQQNLVERGQLLPDRKNIFAYPLGPGNLENNFTHAGGEIIFSLPNGLQGFMLVNANNLRIDKGPVQIVSDPRRPDRAVETGVSCMSCHIPGILVKADQVHDYLLKNPKAYPKADADLIRVLYPPKEATLAQMQADGKRYQAAVAQTGAKIGKSEPVTTVVLKYESDLDAVSAAAELGMTADQFRTAITRSDRLMQNLGALQLPGGTVHRPVWVQSFGDIVSDLKLGVLFSGSQVIAALRDNTGDVDPLESRGAQANQFAFSKDGRTAIVAGADRTVRIHEVEGRRDLRRLIGHLGSVWSVARSADGKRILSGGIDQTVRLWDANASQPLRTLEGHDALVTAVAFVPNSALAVSGSFDGTIIVWDLDKGTEVRRFAGKGRYVHALTVTNTGDEVIAAIDQRIVRWQLSNGTVRAEWKGHTDAVTCLTIAPDDSMVVSGSDDGTLRLWERATGKEVRSFTGHTGPVKSVVWWSNPAWLASAGGDGKVRLWQTATGQELGVFHQHNHPVVSVGFTAEARQTVSGDQAGNVLVWNLDKFLPPPAPVAVPAPEYPVETLTQAPKLPLEPRSPAPAPATPPVTKSQWEPKASLPLPGPVAAMHLSANGKWLYLLDASAGRIVRVDTGTMSITQTYTDATGRLECMRFSADEKTIWCIGSSTNGSGHLVAVDAVTLKAEPPIGLKFTPFDLTIADADTGFITGQWAGQWAIGRIEWKSGKVVAKWPIAGQAFVTMVPTQQRLLVSYIDGPGRLEAWTFGKDGKRSPKMLTIHGATDGELQGEPTLLGTKSLIYPSGVVVNLNPNQEDDFTIASTTAFTGISTDASGSAVTLHRSGEIRHFSAGKWQNLTDSAVKALPYSIGWHAGTKRVYLAIVDPQAITARPRGNGFGMVWALDLPTSK